MENLIKLTLGFVFIIFVSYLVYQIYEQANSETYTRLSQELDDVRSGNDKIASTNDLLRVRIDAIRTDRRAIERKVRDELGMARPDEVMILIKNDDENSTP